MHDSSLEIAGRSLARIYQMQREAREAHSRQVENEHRRAIEELLNRLKQEAHNPSIYLQIAKHYEDLGEYKMKLATLDEGLALCPPTADLYLDAINTLQETNRTAEGRRVACRAAELCPDDRPLFRLKAALLLPLLYDTPEEVAFYREQFEAGMKELLAGLKLDTPTAHRQALRAIANHCNFYLTYQGEDTRELQTQYGKFVQRIMAANYPEWAQPLDVPPLSGNGRIRVGYISQQFCHNVVMKTHSGWLTEHDPSGFEVFAYHLGSRVDAVTDLIRGAVDHFQHIPKGLEQACQAIRADNLHVAVFLEVGWTAKMTRIAALRLAPIQCATWGHPVTSGSPSVDYFLSSLSMESEEGQQHYSECLIRLPGIGVCYRKPIIPWPFLTRKRDHFGLGKDRTVYWCCQSNFKYLPHNDELFARIAKRLAGAQFVFVVRGTCVGDDLRRRLGRAFAAEGIRAEDHCLFLPTVDNIDYWSRLLVSDVFLDPLEFNGCNTTLEAIASGIPVVTLPGKFLRGRASYGILTQLGVTETIARDKEEYVDIAVRLGQDIAWRAQIVERMKANEKALFGDTRSVRALEEFFRRAVRVT